MTVQQVQRPSRSQLASLTLGQLWKALISESSHNHLYREEGRRREVAERISDVLEGLPSQVEEEPVQQPSQPIEEAKQEEVEPEEFWETARDILKSKWDYSGLRNSTDAPGFVKAVVKDKMTEEDMTDQMVRYFKSIRSNFRQWQRLHQS